MDLPCSRSLRFSRKALWKDSLLAGDVLDTDGAYIVRCSYLTGNRCLLFCDAACESVQICLRPKTWS